MASISSIISFESSAPHGVSASEGTVYTRASSMVSFPGSEDIPAESRALSPSSTYAATPSCRSSPAVASPALASVLPTAADAAAAAASAAASAAADATRRRKVLTSRPPNSFILYRSDKLRELVQEFPDLKQTQISKMCAENWKNESAQVKDFYRRKQQEAKAQFLSEQALEMERISGGSSDKTIIKRIQPTNTFIRYRTEMKKKLASQFAAMNQKDVSRACGLMWRSEPEHVKMRYRQSYNKEKRDFERLCSTSALDEQQPSKEALSALASVIAEASKDNKAAAASKKRRLSEGCRSVPVSPPQADIGEQVRTKRLRSFHAPSPSCSELTVSSSPAASPATVPSPRPSISLPSCASLLSMAGTSPIPAPAQPPAMPTLLYPLTHAFHKQPEHARRTYHASPPYYAHGYPAAALPPPPPTHFPGPHPTYHSQVAPRTHYNVHH